jgi:hypothetical protein
LSTRSSPIAAIPALLLVVVSLWEVAATRCDATSVPDDDAWKRAEAVVRAEYRPGDLIVFAPDWVDPVGRLHLGDLISVDVAARMDAARFSRIWEVAIRGARAPETEGMDPVATVDDAVTVRRFERAPAIVISDIRDHLSEAKLDGGTATLELAEVGFAPHRCIRVVPAPGKPVRVAFPALPVGGELVGYVGIADVFTRRDVRSPGHLDVEIAGKRVASIDAGIDDGWVRFAAPTTPGTADVAFVATARDAGRLICFAAEARQ